MLKFVLLNLFFCLKIMYNLVGDTMKIINFPEYKILDTKNGMKLESWNGVKLLRPDPQIIWTKDKKDIYSNVDAKYIRSNKGGGEWQIFNKNMPSVFQIHYDDLTFNLKLMGFKHTGIFPEQAYNWTMLQNIISKRKNVKVLNLFAYTGAASIACLKAGASVVHVDSSRGMVDWAKENVKSSNLEDKPIRFIVDDVVKFVEREIRRGNKYDAIIMDPPSYGRGPNKELWRLEDNLYELIEKTMQLLSEDPLFVIVNCYSSGITPLILNNLLNKTIKKTYNGNIETNELGLPIQNQNMILPCGIYGRWYK